MLPGRKRPSFSKGADEDGSREGEAGRGDWGAGVKSKVAALSPSAEGAPQEEQNRVSAGTSLPQLVHVAIFPDTVYSPRLYLMHTDDRIPRQQLED